MTYTIVVTFHDDSQGGCYTTEVTDGELMVSGFGNTERGAIRNGMRVLRKAQRIKRKYGLIRA